MKQKISVFMITILISLCILGMTAFAESEAQSEIKITFEAYSGATEPLDPNNPGNFLAPSGQGTGAPGPLSIDYVPVLSLGSVQQISTFEQAYPVTSDRPFLQATDLRGTGSGWSIRVAASEFMAQDNSTLPGASLVFYDGAVISPNMTAQEPVVYPSVIAYAGGTPADLFTAEAGAGKGTWLARWYDVPDAPQVGRIEVVIPGGIAHVGDYTATIHWQLMDVE